MRIIIIAFFSFISFFTKSQTKEYDTCVTWETHKGKINHGKKYCVVWATIRDYGDGRKDTVGKTYAGQSFINDEWDKYQSLSERGKYIVDSLKEDGIIQLQNWYLCGIQSMGEGKKTQQFWSIEGKDINIYEYFFWKNNKECGTKLIKKYILK